MSMAGAGAPPTGAWALAGAAMAAEPRRAAARGAKRATDLGSFDDGCIRNGLSVEAGFEWRSCVRDAPAGRAASAHRFLIAANLQTVPATWQVRDLTRRRPIARGHRALKAWVINARGPAAGSRPRALSGT